MRSSAGVWWVPGSACPHAFGSARGARAIASVAASNVSPCSGWARDHPHPPQLHFNKNICPSQEGEAQLAELAALLHESMDHKYS